MVREAWSPLSLSLRGARGSLKPVAEMEPILAASAVVMRLVLRGTDCLESKVNSIVFREKVALRSSARPVFAPHQQYRALQEPTICSNHPKPPTTTRSAAYSPGTCCASSRAGAAAAVASGGLQAAAAAAGTAAAAAVARGAVCPFVEGGEEVRLLPLGASWWWLSLM